MRLATRVHLSHSLLILILISMTLLVRWQGGWSGLLIGAPLSLVLMILICRHWHRRISQPISNAIAGLQHRVAPTAKPNDRQSEELHQLLNLSQHLSGHLNNLLGKVEQLDRQQAAVTAACAKAIVRIDQQRGTTERIQQQVDRDLDVLSSNLNQTDQCLHGLADQIQFADQNMTTLAQLTEPITEAARKIHDLSTQTRRLALNASIQAARAGDRGRAFEVIAAEVRHLAEQTRMAAAKISEFVLLLVDMTDRSAQQTAQSLQQMQSLSQQHDQLQDQAQQLHESIRQAVSDLNTMTHRAGQLRRLPANRQLIHRLRSRTRPS